VPLQTSLFDFPIPERLIAQQPSAKRDESRLLVVDRRSRSLRHLLFKELPGELSAGDTLFRNSVSVLPARLHARRPSGGAVECFLLRPEASDPSVWRCLLKPGRKLPPESRFQSEDGSFHAVVAAKHADGSATVRFTTPQGENITDLATRLGRVPLPPYISRPRASLDEPQNAFGEKQDRERYQTVYADPRHRHAVAAPTAGLHFTPEVLAALGDSGVSTAEIFLHVGLGTFKPISTPTIEEHQIHTETYEMPLPTQHALFPPLAGRRIAVGTTSVRSIEDFLARNSRPASGDWRAEASLFIHPPRAFLGVDALLTNFHQPRSTLLCLVASFLTPGTCEGISWLREIYAEAVAREYRFFSYGDAMLIL